MKALGIDPHHEMTVEEKKMMPLLFLSGIAASFIVIYGMMVIINSLKVYQFFIRHGSRRCNLGRFCSYT
jgi:hypothetical protein